MNAKDLNALRATLVQPPVATYTDSGLVVTRAQVRLAGLAAVRMATLATTLPRAMKAHPERAEALVREMEVHADQAVAYRVDLHQGQAEVRVWAAAPKAEPEAGDLLYAEVFESMPAAMEAVRGRGPGAGSVALAGQARFLAVTVHHASGWVASVLPELQRGHEVWTVVGPHEVPAWLETQKAPRMALFGGSDVLDA
jgi:hypothetical protein